jgi:uncharacterized protein (TIGR00661 family)
MRVLYGVVGEGMGHATRSRVVLEMLLAGGHSVRVVVSGRAHDFLRQSFSSRAGIAIEEIHGLHLSYDGNALDVGESMLTNLEKAPAGVVKNIAVYQKVAEDGFKPDLVVSDFESWAYLYGRNHRLPVISIDNMQVINRCLHAEAVTGEKSFDAWLAKWAVKVKLPGAYHYLVTSFFFPKVRKKRTTLVPPILRPEILKARREPGAHVLVYQTAASNTELVPTLNKLDYRFKVYGMRREGVEGNVTLCAFSPTGFVDDLRTARGVIAGGGFSLMGEAVHLHVPMLSVPIAGQYEQVLNARYLAHLGYGDWSKTLDVEAIEAFLRRTDEFSQKLEAYAPRDNSMLEACLSELLSLADIGAPRPTKLASPALGKFEDSLLPDEPSVP